MPNVKRLTLQPHILRNARLEMTVHADELKLYVSAEHNGYSPKPVNLTAVECVGFDGTPVNAIEIFWRH